jgi:WD40 repeat protein
VGSVDGTAHIVEAATGREVSRVVTNGSIRSVAFSPDDTWVAAGSADGTLRILEAANGREVLRLLGRGAVS